MQYALLQVAENYRCLVDANELKALNTGEEHIIERPLDDSLFQLKIFYGCYFRQKDKNYTDSDVLSHIEEAKDKWLIHLSDMTGIYLGIKDIIILEKDQQNRLAFASLVSVPAEFELNRGNAKTAFLRWHNTSILTNLLNRDGLFSFISEEKRNIHDLNQQNWKNKVDRERAVKNAFSIY
jgi:hypothetical protein